MDCATRTAPEISRIVTPVLMAGGNGSRLWPLSRESYPKQFLALSGAHSLLQNTALRARAIADASAPVVIGSDAHRFLIAEQLRDAGIGNATLLLEPEGRDTAPAAAVAAHYVAGRFGDEAIVFLMAADHAITDLEGFYKAVATGVELAEQGHIVTFGVHPTGPETGFGYLQCSAALDDLMATRQVQAFVEKPDSQRAQSFCESGDHYWNSGMFMFRADRFLSVLESLEPELSQGAGEAVRLAVQGPDEMSLSLHPESFSSCRKISIDYAVMEKLDDLVLVPLDVGWDDVGSWSFLGLTPASDEHGNHVRGQGLMEDSHRNLVQARRRLVAMLGVDDCVVVESDDAILVAARDRLQDVGKLVKRLQTLKRPEAESLPRVARPWGHYETVALGDRFQVKRITVKPGHKLSLQMHHHRAEHWVVVRGTAKVTCGEREYLVSEDQSTYIPLGTTHRVENPGKVPLEMIEVQSGAYLGEDDIVRFDDVYGRKAE